MRKLKSLKGKSLVRYGFAELGDMEFPIKTAGVKGEQLNLLEVMEEFKIPTKSVRMTEEEKEEMRSRGYTDDRFVPYKTVYDMTSKEYNDYVLNKTLIELFHKLACNIDLKYKLENKKELWEDISLADDKDYIGMAVQLGDMGFDNIDYLTFQNKITKIKQSGYKSYEEVDDNDDSENGEEQEKDA